jgi:transposase
VPRTCTVCSHPEREAIDEALVSGASNRSIASKCGVSEAAVRRHKANHIPAKLALAAKKREEAESAEADDLLGRVEDLQERTLAILEAAEDTGELKTALSAIREARGNLELVGRLTRELDERPINVLISPEWLELRAVIVTALEPHQEARYAVLRALEGSGNGRA